MSPAVQGSFTRVSTVPNRCKHFWGFHVGFDTNSRGSRQVSGGVRSVAARTAVQAHRGSPDPASGVVENTLEAFHRARELGADGVELDVRLTADGGLAVHHDAVVPGAGPVHELATADLPDHVPLLADALEACTGMLVNIEIKNHPGEAAFDPSERASGLVVAEVEELGRVRDGRHLLVLVGRPGRRAFGRAPPAVRAPGGPLVRPGVEHRGRPWSWAVPPSTFPSGSVDGPTVAAAHDVGLAVAAWTVADEVDPGRGARRRGGHGHHRRRGHGPPGRRQRPDGAGPPGRAVGRTGPGAVGRPVRSPHHPGPGPPDLGRGADWSPGSVFVNNARL